MDGWMDCIGPKLGSYSVAALKKHSTKINYTVVTETLESMCLQESSQADVQQTVGQVVQ